MVNSRYPVTEADAVYLAGLYINLLYGNFDPNKDVIAQVVYVQYKIEQGGKEEEEK